MSTNERRLWPDVVEEGSKCPCGGTMVVKPVETCSCHIAPPCNECIEKSLRCEICDDYPEYQP